MSPDFDHDKGHGASQARSDARRRKFLLRSAGVTTFAATLASRPALGHVIEEDGPGSITALCSPTNSHTNQSVAKTTGYHCDWWCGSVQNWRGVHATATFGDFGCGEPCGVSSGTRLRDALVSVYTETKCPSNPPRGYSGGYWSCSQSKFESTLQACIACGLLNSEVNAPCFGYTVQEFINAVRVAFATQSACYTKTGIQSALCKLLADICQEGRQSIVGGLNSCWDSHCFGK